jgi:hypothetical protein
MNLKGPKTTIALENIRNLTLSLTIASYLMPLRLEPLVVLFGVGLGAYYGLKIEKETFYMSSFHKELNQKGGRYTGLPLT